MELIYKEISDGVYQVIAEIRRLPSWHGQCNFLTIHLRCLPDLIISDKQPDSRLHNILELKRRNLKVGPNGDSIQIFEALSDLEEIDSPDLKLVEDGPYLQ